SGKRLRSARGGKRPALAPAPADLLPMLPLLLDQETVSQHDQHTVAVKAGPQPPLILVPAEQALGLLVELFHPVTPVRVLRHPPQGGFRAEVAPVVLPLVLLAPGRALADQPARHPNPRRWLPPTAQRMEACLEPALGALAPADRLPTSLRHGGQHRLGVLRRPVGRQRHLEVLADRGHVTLVALLQACQEVG